MLYFLHAIALPAANRTRFAGNCSRRKFRAGCGRLRLAVFAVDARQVVERADQFDVDVSGQCRGLGLPPARYRRRSSVRRLRARMSTLCRGPDVVEPSRV